jgi:metal-responsive CopG/Arc/MetJ family transcriptional regulator
MSDHGKIPSKRRSVRFTDPLHDELRRIAEREGNSVSSVVRRLIEQGIAQERAQRPREARTTEPGA